MTNDHLVALPEAIQQLQSKIHNRLPITMVTIGGSNSAGGGLDQAEQIYTNQIASWWDKKVYNETGSKLMSHNIAMGGTTSDVFLFCLQNYLPSLSPDIVLIELAANDFGSIYGKAAQPMELLTRRLLLQPSNPLVIYLHFINPAIVDGRITNTMCTNMQNFGFDDLARHYHIPAFSLKDVLCPAGITGVRILDDSMIDMFASDGNHIGFKSHTVIATQIKKYLIKITVGAMKHKNFNSVNNMQRQLTENNTATTAATITWTESGITTAKPTPYIIIQKPLFCDSTIQDDQLNDARCLSHLTPDYNAPLYQTLEAKVIRAHGFRYQTPFEGRKGKALSSFRTDGVGGWIATPGLVKLELEFDIPSPSSSSPPSSSTSSSSRSIAVLFKFDMNNPLSIKLSLNNDRNSCTQIIVSSNAGSYKTINYVFPIATGILPGVYALTIQGRVNDLHFLGIAVVYEGFHGYQGFKSFDGILKPC